LSRHCDYFHISCSHWWLILLRHYATPLIIAIIDYFAAAITLIRHYYCHYAIIDRLFRHARH
jgi:hypothetical protein